MHEFVRDVALETTIDEAGDVWISSSAMVEFGGMSMTSVTLPIINPAAPGKLYGKFEINPTLGSTMNEIVVKVNLSESAKVPGSANVLLPNGQALPLAGLGNVNLIQLNVDQINSKIYIGLGHDITFLGYAITIAEFAQVAKYSPNANVFLGFEFGGVKGAAGMFTGTTETKSGLAFFVDLSKIITTDILNDIIVGIPSEREKLALIGKETEQKALGMLPMRATNVLERKLSKSAQKDLDKGLYNMAKKTKILHVQ